VLVQEQLDAFVDDELTGAERLDVVQHVQICASCARAVDELTTVGELLRGSSASEVPYELSGLAAGVISRTRAEAALSWQGRISRACEDWHWFVVGGGSVAATFVSTLLLSAILAFGPEPERHDSVAGFYVSDPAGAERDIRLLGANRSGSGSMPFSSTGTEVDAVGQLAWASWRPGSNRSALDPANRLIQEALLDEIVRMRLDAPEFLGRWGRPAIEDVRYSEVISRRPASVAQ
jgi:hypothetical protein